MGERVVIGREPPLAQEAPPSQPLDYGKGGQAEDFWRNVNAWAQAAGELITRGSILAWPHVKAWWRQVVFALGLGCVFAGLGHCLHRHTYDDSAGVVLMFVGGVMIGICVRVPLIGQSK